MTREKGLALVARIENKLLSHEQPTTDPFASEDDLCAFIRREVAVALDEIAREVSENTAYQPVRDGVPPSGTERESVADERESAILDN